LRRLIFPFNRWSTTCPINSNAIIMRLNHRRRAILGGF
jgi:hypothetical protein